MRMGPVLFLGLVTAAAHPLTAQWSGSAAAGAGVVRYAGGSSFSAFTLAPAAQRFTASSYLGISGALSLLSGASAEQGRMDFWTALSRDTIGIRPALSATVSASARSDGLAAGSATALVEAVSRVGAVGAGFVTGALEGEPGVGAFRLRARSWRQLNATAQLSATAEATHLLGSWYSDVLGGVTIDRPRVAASFWLSGRLSQSSASSAAASASIQYFLNPHVAIEASGGNYLRDPFQGLPRAGFIAGGVRLFRAPRALTTEPAPPAGPRLQPLIASHRGGDTVVVRFRMPGAYSVGIAGNWNGWTPEALHALGEDIWEAELRLAPGTYHFNLVVDGNEWVVPAGVAVISDGMGGMLAVLNVL